MTKGIRMTVEQARAHQERHGFISPSKNGHARPSNPKGKLRRQREPNQTERDFGLVLAAMQQRGEIEYYGFEEITLRWSGMAYTPDWFVIRQTVDVAGSCFLEVVYYEVKGGYRYEDSVVKYKAARDRFKWATFQMWQKQAGQWSQIA